MEAIEFSNLFNEGTIIKFTSNDLNKNTEEIKEFKRKLEIYEKEHSLIEDFDTKDLSILINNDVFSNSEYHVDSSWLEYFITKYKIDVNGLDELMNSAISQEDYNAVKIFLNHGYIVSFKNIELAKDINKNAIAMTEINKKHDGIDEKGDPTFYDDEYSKIKEIEQLIKEKYKLNIISDPDGYTNLRKKKILNQKFYRK